MVPATQFALAAIQGGGGSGLTLALPAPQGLASPPTSAAASKAPSTPGSGSGPLVSYFMFELCQNDISTYVSK